MPVVPQDNQEAFSLIFEIENALRELIVETLSKMDGQLWYKTRLPGEALKKYREGIGAEHSMRWSKLIPHHPMYYIDFPHLRETILNRKNWDSAFKDVFGRREVFEGSFVELEGIRNRVAHNRRVSAADLTITRAVHSVMGQCIGESRFTELALRSTTKTDLPADLAELKDSVEFTYQELESVAPLSRLRIWSRISQEWWFDDDYLSKDLRAVRDFFSVAEKYAAIPRERGVGHKIESWLRTTGFEALYKESSVCLEQLLRSI